LNQNQELSRAVISEDHEKSLIYYGKASSDYLAVKSESAFIRDLADKTSSGSVYSNIVKKIAV